jgi:L-iditol 2-dehydrogenase
MKALVLAEYKKFEYLDVPDPAIGPDDVLIKVKACGICGSDIHGMDGSTGRRQPPIIMGHEAAGIIAKVGKDVANWKIGDRVTFDSTIYCGKCFFCLKGLINLCDNRRVAGVSCDDYRRDGAFAEYISVPQHILYKLPEGISFENAAMVEALSIAFHAVERTAISLNDTAVVLGAGMIGLLVIQSLRMAGCGKIIAIDIDQGKLDLAIKHGANVSLNSKKDEVKTEILNLTDGRGVDVAIEAVGISATVQLGIDCLKKGGIMTLVGNISPTIELPLQSVVTREITINGSCASCGEYPACLEMIADGKIDVDSLISAKVPLSEGSIWFNKLYNKEPNLLKVVLIP